VEKVFSFVFARDFFIFLLRFMQKGHGHCDIVRMSQCVFSIDGFNDFAEKPVTTTSIENNHFTVKFSAAYCANDHPAPTLRWQCTWNARQFSIVCRIVNNAKTWTCDKTDEKCRVIDVKYVFDNYQKPVRAFCDEYGTQYKSLLYLRGTLEFTIHSQVAEPVSVDEDEHVECCVCLDEAPNIMNDGCKHKVMCIACAIKYTEDQSHTCPVCRAPITKLYLERTS